MSLTRLIATRACIASTTSSDDGENEGAGGREEGLACERTILNEIYSGGQTRGGRDYTKCAARSLARSLASEKINSPALPPGT